jgi:hypothetical protein
MQTTQQVSTTCLAVSDTLLPALLTWYLIDSQQVKSKLADETCEEVCTDGALENRGS